MYKAILEKLPVAIQNLLFSTYGIYWYQRRFGGVYSEQLQLFKSREFYTKNQWYDYQNEKLSQILINAIGNVPFYKDLYKNKGFSRNEIKKIDRDSLKSLPFLEKDNFRRYGRTRLISVKAERGIFLSSSGSTGTPLSIFYSRKMHQTWTALFEARIRNWAGVDQKTPKGMIGGRRIISSSSLKPPFYRYNAFEKQTYFSAYHITPKTVKNYVKGQQKYNVKYMMGYAMSNYFLAKMIEEEGINAPEMKAVITSSEILTQEMRETFERVYNCKTYDTYSGNEACGLISQTREGALLVSPDAGILEILKEDGTPAKPGELGEVVWTGLLNFDQPLIRYRIGDLVRLHEDQSPVNGRYMPRIKEIIGRVEDTIYGKDGRAMVRFHSLYLNLEDLIAAQIIQHDYDKFEFNLVCEERIDKGKTESIISERLESQLGVCNTTFNYVQSLPRGENGKVKAVISKLKN